MKSAIVGAVVILIIVVGFVLLLGGNENTWICSNGQWIMHGYPSAAKPTKPCPVQKTSTSAVNPNANIQLLSPKTVDTLSSQFVIKGQARVFENQLNFRVRNSKGQPLIEGTMTAKASDVGKFGTFEATVSSLPKGKTTIEVFDHSAKDGSEVDKVSVGVTVK